MKLENLLSLMALALLALLPTSGQAQVPEDYPYGPMLKDGYTWYYWFDNSTEHYQQIPGYSLFFSGRSVVDGHECVNCYINKNDEEALIAQMFVDEENRIWAYINLSLYDQWIEPCAYLEEDLPILIFDPNDMKSFFEERALGFKK